MSTLRTFFTGLAGVISSFFLMAGCVYHVPNQPSPKRDHEQTAMILRQAAASAATALNTLAEVDRAVHPTFMPSVSPDANSYGMGERVSLEWHGPIQPVIKNIAKMSDYKLITLGKPPAIPILVSISADCTPIGDILRDIGFQATRKASVIVFPSTHTIELRYAAA